MNMTQDMGNKAVRTLYFEFMSDRDFTGNIVLIIINLHEINCEKYFEYNSQLFEKRHN